MSGIDISKVMGLIAEHPEIIASIQSIAENAGMTENTAAVNAEEKSTPKDAEMANTELFSEKEDTASASAMQKNAGFNREKKRHDLLCAIKPYVSQHRGAAIDTMLSIFDIINLLSVR